MTALGLLAWALACWTGGGVASAQSGEFVIPSIRADNGTRFAYWDGFSFDPVNGGNYNYANPPALYGGEDDAEIEDEDGNILQPANVTNLLPPAPQSPGAWVKIVQDGTDTAFVTSAGGIYSFMEPTSFYMEYSPPHEDDVTSVIFQILTLGRSFDVDDIVLEYQETVDGEEITREVQAQYRGLDDPQSGDFYNGVVSAFQWNLTGLGVRDFRLVFASTDSSMSLRQAQLDVVEGGTFTPELSFLLFKHTLPRIRGGGLGLINATVVGTDEDRFFEPGQSVTLTGVPQSGIAHVGWLIDGTPVEAPALVLTFENADQHATAIFAPKTYAAWRERWFNHASFFAGLLDGQTDHSDVGKDTNDHLDPRYSTPDKDPEGDGQDNFTEFAFGGDPYAHDHDATAPSAVLLEDGALGLVYRQPATEEVAVKYQLQASTDLQTWTDVEAVTLDKKLRTSGYWQVTVREAVPEGASPHPFLRVQASVP